jgi:hypothetical protein
VTLFQIIMKKERKKKEKEKEEKNKIPRITLGGVLN